MISRFLENLHLKLYLKLFFFIIISYSESKAQKNYYFSFDTIRVPNWPSIHSFTYGEWEGKVYMFGGRKNGIHEKKSGFERKTNNRQLFIWDPYKMEVDSIDLHFLPDSIIDHLSAAGTSFAQKNQFLYVIGGYGQNAQDSFVTFPSLLVIDLSQAHNLDIWKNDPPKVIRQVQNPNFAIAGGQMGLINDQFILVGGNQFTGKYDDNSVGVTQKYSDKAVSFNISISESNIEIFNWHEMVDEFNFHRRDYNLVPFYFGEDQLETMIFSGVFLVNVNRPFLNIARVNATNFEDIPNFSQLLANYHCAKLGFYEKESNTMRQWFFGGMAEYYINDSNLIISDPRVPFVNTVSSVTRNNANIYEETYQKIRLPGFFGTNSEVFIFSNIPKMKNEHKIINLDLLQDDSILLGYIFGGIYNPTSEPNPWAYDKAHLTIANPYLIKINYHLLTPNGNTTRNSAKSDFPKLNIFPQPVNDYIRLNFENYTFNHIQLWLVNQTGQKVKYQTIIGESQPIVSIKDLPPGNYTLYIYLDNKFTYAQKLVLAD